MISAVSNLLGNTPLERAMQDNLDRIGPPPFDDGRSRRRGEFQATLTEEDIEAAFRRVGLPVAGEHAVVRPDHSAGCDARRGERLDRCRRRELGGADGAGARCDLRDRHTGSLLAVDRTRKNCRRPTRAWCTWRR